VIRVTSETALAALIVWILVWSLAIAVAGACQGCAVSHVRPAADAGVQTDAELVCLRWQVRANPEDVFCAEWRGEDGGR
jgi:AhpD family alkylhydroperoxidase